MPVYRFSALCHVASVEMLRGLTVCVVQMFFAIVWDPIKRIRTLDPLHRVRHTCSPSKLCISLVLVNAVSHMHLVHAVRNMHCEREEQAQARFTVGVYNSY